MRELEERNYILVCVYFIFIKCSFSTVRVIRHPSPIKEKSHLNLRPGSPGNWLGSRLWISAYRNVSHPSKSPCLLTRSLKTVHHGVGIYFIPMVPMDYCSDLRISLFKLEVTGSMQIHIFFFLFNMCKTRQKFQILICFFLSIFFPFFPLTFIHNLLPQVYFLVQINTKIWSEINIFFLVCLFSFL